MEVTQVSNNRLQIANFFSAIFFSAFSYEYIVFVMTVYVYDLSKDALSIGVFTALTFVPRLFSSLIGGIADQLGKKRCFAVSALMVCALLLVMANLTNMAALYGTWFAANFFLTCIINVRGSLMAEIISREKYAAGNSLALVLLNAAKLLAPLLGGMIAVYFTLKPLIYLACVIYLLIGVLACNLGDIAQGKKTSTNFWVNAKKGFQFMTANRAFGRLALIAFSWRLFLGLQLSLFVVYVKTALGGSTEQYGVFMALMGCGSIAGSILGPQVIKRKDSIRPVIIGLCLHYASFIALGLCTDYYLALGIIFSSYLIFYMTLVGIHTVRDRITPSEIRASAYGTVTAILTPPAIISMLAGGYFASRFDAAAVLIGIGVLALLSLCVIPVFSAEKKLLSY